MNEISIDSKMTKTQIIEAYNVVFAKLKELSSQTMGVSAQIQSKEDARTLSTAHASTVENTINEVLHSLTSFREVVKEKFQALSAVEAAIELKNTELETLFGIEKEALSLAAFVDTRKVIKQQLEDEYVNRKKLIESELNALKETIKSELDKLVVEKNAFVTEFNELKKKSERELQLYKERTKEEFEYQHARDIKEAQDALQDKLNEMTAAFENRKNTKLAALDEREKAVKEREEKVLADITAFDAMKREVEEVPSIIEAKVQQKQAVILKTLTEKFENDKKLFVLEHQSNNKAMEAKIEALERQNAELVAANKQLESKLTAAYSEIKEMANKAFDSASGKKELDSIMKFAEQQNQKNTNK